MVHKKPLKIGSWLFYKQDGSLYAYTEFAVHKKKGTELMIKEQIIPKKYHIVKKNGKLVNEKGK